jgi:hypothetical protein
LKKTILILLVGLAIGYRIGYGDAANRRPTLVQRTLDRFGAAKIGGAQRDRERQADAIKP